jgi:hypothetical protein
MLVAGSMMLIVCMITAFFDKMRSQQNNAAAVSTRVYGGITGGLLFGVGSIFKLMWWPGANIMLLLGVLLVCLIYLPLFFIEQYRKSMRAEVK